MRKDLVKFLHRIGNLLMYAGCGIQIILTTIAYFTNADVASYLLYNAAPYAWAMVIVGLMCELLQIALTWKSNEESEELL